MKCSYLKMKCSYLKRLAVELLMLELGKFVILLFIFKCFLKIYYWKIQLGMFALFMFLFFFSEGHLMSFVARYTEVK